MFQNVKEYLDTGFKEKIIGFSILFVTTYSILWNLINPLFTSTTLENSSIYSNWWCLQIILSFLVSTFIFYQLLPKRHIEKFGFGTDDTDFIFSAKETIRSSPQPKMDV